MRIYWIFSWGLYKFFFFLRLPKYVEKLPELFNFSVEEIREMSDLCRKKVLPKQNYEECQELNSTELNSKHSNGGKEINIEDGISSVNSCFTIER